MAVNPDPRPGRWLLPLVVLGMVLFTYVFVRSLPGADADAQDLTGGETTTTTTTAPSNGDTTTTTETTTPVDPEVEAYLSELEALETDLTTLQTEMATINAQWDADPREITYQEAESQLVDLADRVAAWAGEVAEIAPPASLVTLHQTITQFANAAAQSATEVVDGLRAPDTGELRREAVENFDDAVRGFTAAVDQAEQAVREGLSG